MAMAIGGLIPAAHAQPSDARPTGGAPARIDNAQCFECHGEASSPKFVDAAAFERSAHGTMSCLGCHTDITELPHGAPLKPISCRQCHTLESEVYLKSDHGVAVHRGVSEAASCRDCHGEPHALLNSRQPESPVFRANIPATCAQCHGRTKDMAKFHLSQAAPIATYEETVHGIALKQGISASAVCTDCHGSHDLHKPTNPASKLYWQTIPATCGKCHENIQHTYQRSVHGQAVAMGKRDAPVCTDCHGEHSITAVALATSKVFPSHIPETCGQCHAAERITTKYQLPEHVVETYMQSYHGLALQLGSVTAANCASCHGAHDILPSSDPRSSVHPKNLARTCGSCHAGVTAQVAKGQIHSGTQPGLEHRIVAFIRRFYLWLILLVIGGMLLHNLLDFRRKLLDHYRHSQGATGRMRMSLNERIQHAVLAVAFVTLAYTGFALKFPQAWWASPFMGRLDWRSGGHRLAALFFVALSLYHVWFMFFTARGRRELAALRPQRHDFIQPFQALAHAMGWRRDRPVFARYSYVEKMEYWALVWGSIIMTITGALLTWEGWTLRLFPKWIFDVVMAIHYYEAILACLAILIWHGYFVMFDPEEYPMKWTWISGEASKADQANRREDDHGAPNSPPSSM